MHNYVAEAIDISKLRKNEFNVIVSGCGTGKTYFVAKYLPEMLGVNYEDIVFVTSRRTIVDQMEFDDKATRLIHTEDRGIVDYWNDATYALRECKEKGMRAMTYGSYINTIKYGGNAEYGALNNAKVIIIDECHAMFTDIFISDVFAMWLDISNKILHGDMYVIGMTATISPIFFGANRNGVKINMLLDEPLVRYKAKKLWVVDEKSMEQMIGDKQAFPGKNLIMCTAIRKCQDLTKKLKNSMMLVSNADKNKRSGIFDKDMDWLRDTILKTSSLPSYGHETMEDGTVRSFPLETLITTSTLREGVNLIEESGIRNVYCYCHDEVSIIQFLGRCRFNVDNLIIVKTSRSQQVAPGYTFNNDRQNLFCEFLSNGNPEWLKNIEHVIEHEEGALPKVYNYPKDVYGGTFYDWFDKNYAIPGNEIRVYDKKDKETIIRKAFEYGIVPKKRCSQITFPRVVDAIEASGMYKVIDGQARTKEGRLRCKKFVRIDSAGKDDKEAC